MREKTTHLGRRQNTQSWNVWNAVLVLGVSISIVGLTIPVGSAEDADFLDFVADGPGGGDRDYYGECDTIATACAAAAAIALDGCVSATLDASAAGVALVAILPAFGAAHATGTITVCQSISNVDMLPGSNLIPASITSNGVAGYPINTCDGGIVLSEGGVQAACTVVGWNGLAVHRSNVCTTLGLGHVACGIGATYQLDWQDCVGAEGLATVNDGQGYTRPPPMPIIGGAAVPKEGEASARVFASSASCPNPLLHHVSTIPPPEIVCSICGDTPAAAPSPFAPDSPEADATIPLDQLTPGIQRVLKDRLERRFLNTVDEAFGDWAARAPAGQQDVLDLLHGTATSGVSAAAQGFQGIAYVTLDET